MSRCRSTRKTSDTTKAGRYSFSGEHSCVVAHLEWRAQAAFAASSSSLLPAFCVALIPWPGDSVLEPLSFNTLSCRLFGAYMMRAFAFCAPRLPELDEVKLPGAMPTSAEAR